MLNRMLLIAGCFALIFVLPAAAFALTVGKITPDETAMTVAPSSELWLTGTLSPARGQAIVVTMNDGNRTVSSCTAPKNEQSWSYRMKVPRQCLSREGILVLHIQALAAKGVAASRNVPITVTVSKSAQKDGGKTDPAKQPTAKKTQAKKKPAKKTTGTQKTGKKKKKNKKTRQTLTGGKNRTVSMVAESFPLGVRAAGGARLRYKSSNPKVAGVNKKGYVTPKKKGRATITVTASETSQYKSAKINVRITIRKPTAAEGRKAAVAWAKKIARDNSFTYGAGSYAHHNGCYFCHTNGGKARRAKGTRWAKGYKGKKWAKTYCCNPFVHAAYAHGAKHPKMLRKCKSMETIDMHKSTYRSMGCFKSLGKPSFGRLIPGDIFVNGDHVWMYCGKDKLVEATSCGGGKASWSAASISVKGGAKKRYRECRFVVRFKGY